MRARTRIGPGRAAAGRLWPLRCSGMSGAVFVSAMWIGLSIAAPVGPIGLLVIQRTLRHGMAVGTATGLGAAVADAVYGAVGAYGVTALMTVLQGLRVPLVLGGGAFLLWLAWRTWRAEPASAQAAVMAPPALWPSFVSTFALTLSNPATVLSFMAIFGALAAQRQDVASPAVMVAGVLVGSALWWFALCAALGRLRQRFDARAQRWVGRVSALMLAAFALWQWATLMRGALD
jgi:threonine/homoserine/homoserine lactone efflux protein